jgi:hypothetical protein
MRSASMESFYSPHNHQIPSALSIHPCDPKETVLVHRFEEVLGSAGIIEFNEDFICAVVRLLSGRWRWLVSDFHKDSKANIN